MESVAVFSFLATLEQTYRAIYSEYVQVFTIGFAELQGAASRKDEARTLSVAHQGFFKTVIFPPCMRDWYDDPAPEELTDVPQP